MSTGQATANAPHAPSGAAAPARANAGPPPDALSELRAVVLGVLRVQTDLAQAAWGVVYLGGGEARASGIFVKHDRAGAADSADAGTLAKLEKLGAELWTAMQQGRLPGGAAEMVPMPRPGALYGEDPSRQVLAAPLSAAGRIEGVSLIVMPVRMRREPAEILPLLAAPTAAFEAFLWRRRCELEHEQKQKLRETLELLDASQQGQDAGAMGAIMCEELKRRFGCTRVSIGLVKGDPIRLVAISGADEIDRRSAAAEALEAVMEECAAQDCELLYPAPPEFEADPGARRVLREHEALSRAWGGGAVLSLPLRVEGDLIGVVVLEREEAFPVGAAALLRLVAETIGPALWTRRLADRGVLAVSRDRLREFGAALVGPRRTGWKIAGAVGALLLLLGAVVPIPDRIRAEAEIQPEVTRTIVPPFAGVLASVQVRPGDAVKADAELARLDTMDLESQAARTRAQRASLETQRDDALSRGDLAKSRSLDAQVREVTAALDLLESQIARAVVRAPIDGVVARGDLEMLVGAPIDSTQALFEIVGPARKAIVKIDEKDAARAAERIREQGEIRGKLMPAALPGRSVDVVIRAASPVAEPTRGGNVFPCEAELLGDASFLRPGMTGTARLHDGRTTVLGYLLRPVVDAARLRLWW